MEISKKSKATGQWHTLEVPITPKAYYAWSSGRDSRQIQHAFPDLTADEREFLVSGTTAEEWAVLFPEEDAIINEDEKEFFKDVHRATSKDPVNFSAPAEDSDGTDGEEFREGDTVSILCTVVEGTMPGGDQLLVSPEGAEAEVFALDPFRATLVRRVSTFIPGYYHRMDGTHTVVWFDHDLHPGGGVWEHVDVCPSDRM